MNQTSLSAGGGGEMTEEINKIKSLAQMEEDIPTELRASLDALQQMQLCVEARLLSEIFFEGGDVYTPHLTATVDEEYERLKRAVVILVGDIDTCLTNSRWGGVIARTEEEE